MESFSMQIKESNLALSIFFLYITLKFSANRPTIYMLSIISFYSDVYNINESYNSVNIG